MLVGIGPMLFDSLETGLTEDCPYGDITTELLGISGEGRFQFISRESAIVSGTLRLKEFFETNLYFMPNRSISLAELPE